MIKHSKTMARFPFFHYHREIQSEYFLICLQSMNIFQTITGEVSVPMKEDEDINVMTESITLSNLLR